MSHKTAAPKFLSVRTAVILTLAGLVACGAGGLTYLDDRSIPAAVIAACAAWAAAVVLFNSVIDRVDS